MTSKPLFRAGDLIPAVCALVLAGVLFVAQVTAGAGDCVRVQTPNGERILSLSDDTEQVFVGHDGLTVTVEVKGGKVRVTHADCPDQVCVHTGVIGENGRAVACVPSGIVLTVDTDNGDAPDAVAR